MKKKISLLLLGMLLFPIITKSQNYQPLLKDGNKWNMLYEMLTTCGCGESRTYSLTLSGDTLIELQNYKKVMCKVTYANYYSVNEMTLYAAALRENNDSQSVYVRYPNMDEQILYTFNHKVGDTLAVTDVYKDTWSDSKTVRTVKRVEQYSMGGLTGKMITISDTSYGYYTSPRWPYKWSNITEIFSDVWYEGIGSMKGMIDLKYLSLPANFNVLQLLCFWNYDNQIYHQDKHSDCVIALWSGINDVSDKQKLIIQNPLNGKINIGNEALSNLAIFQLFDSRGILISKNKLSEDKKSIDISYLNAGLYLYKLMDNGKVLETGKFVKQ